jgi:hypothetical protein
MRNFASRSGLRKHSNAWFALSFLLLWALSSIARADDAPLRRTVRLAYLEGNVTIDRLDNTAGDPAQVNMPLTEGARLNTGDDGQAEVEFEDGSVMRLTPNSSIGLSELSACTSGGCHTNITILRGLIYTEVRATSKLNYRIDADGALITPVANTTIRVKLDQPPAVVSVLDGSVRIEHASTPQADGYKTDVRTGETLISDTSDSSRYSLSQGIEQDSWDEWNRARDQAAVDAAAERTNARDGFAGDQGYGWSDLDANGSWYDVPGQGPVWQPSVAQEDDFDPFGYGSWVSYPGSGYVWASGYIWGWTPFRCGSWAYWNSFGWGWSPGRGCGAAGWGFSGGTGHNIYVINIIRPPLDYRLPTRPAHESGVHRPILVGHPPREPGTGMRPSHEPRMIAGVPVEPRRPVGGPMKHPDGAGPTVGSDRGVDRGTRQPAGAVPATALHNDSRPGTFRQAPPPAVVNGSEPAGRPGRSAPPPPGSRPVGPIPAQGERYVPRPSSPPAAPRSAPPASTPVAPRVPASTPVPAAPRR